MIPTPSHAGHMRTEKHVPEMTGSPESGRSIKIRAQSKNIMHNRDVKQPRIGHASDPQPCRTHVTKRNMRQR